MALRRRIGSALGAAAALAGASVVAGAGVTAGLVGGTAGLVEGAARASLSRAHSAAVSGTRAVGTLLTGADPLPDGRLHDLLDAARGMVEPPPARHTRRVWADRGRVQVELLAPDAQEAPEVRSALRRHLERLEGVEWATVNDVVGRVLVAFDERRVSVEDLVGTVTAIEKARGGKGLFPAREDHPADIEPLLAALTAAGIHVAAVGVAYAAKLSPIPALTRHATLGVVLLESQTWLKRELYRRVGPTGTELAFSGVSALLHALTQSPTVPALNAAAALQEVLEMRAHRQVWRRREWELCRPEPDDGAREPLTPPGPRPRLLPPGPVESYTERLAPTELAASLGLLALTGRPGRSADLLKALSPKAAFHGRAAFATTLDLLLCRRDVLPMDGAAYRRLDRVDAVVVDGDALCTGPPVVLEANEQADGWDDARVWSAAARLVGALEGDEPEEGLRVGPATGTDDAPGADVHTVYQGRRRVGTVTVARELDPHA